MKIQESKMTGDSGGEVCVLWLQAKAALKRTHSKRSAFAMQRAEINVGQAIDLSQIKAGMKTRKSKMAGEGPLNSQGAVGGESGCGLEQSALGRQVQTITNIQQRLAREFMNTRASRPRSEPDLIRPNPT